MPNKLEIFLSSTKLYTGNLLALYEIPSGQIARAFEHFCKTGENPLEKWVFINEFISMVESSSKEGIIFAGSNCRFYTKANILYLYELLSGKSFWHIEEFIKGSVITKKNCIDFLEQVEYIIYLEESCNCNTEKNINYAEVKDKIDKAKSILYEIKTNKMRNKILQKNNRVGFVYLVTAENKYKIGKTKDFDARVMQLKKTNPDLGIVIAVKVKGYDIIEDFLLAKYQSKRITGEWFSFNRTEIQEITNLLGHSKCDV
jgi:hypothetical protein